MSSVNFQARIWLNQDTVEDYDAWVYELFPAGVFMRSGQEWVNEHLADLDAEYWRDELKLEQGNYQILLAGILTGEWRCDEWEEEIAITESSFAKLPDDYFAEDAGPVPEPIQEQSKSRSVVSRASSHA